MLAIYDSTGKIVTTDTKQADITGALNSMEVTIPEGKLLDHIDVSTTTHLPVFVDEPKTPTEMTIEQIKLIVPQLLQMDNTHNKEISTTVNDIAGILKRLNQAELAIEKLQK